MIALTDRRIDAAAAALRASSRAFTSGNLYHAVLRAKPAVEEPLGVEGFRLALKRRLRRGEIAGLLPDPGDRGRRTERASAPMSTRELDAYFPAAILLVDAPAIVDLFVASGALVQTRIAVVCIDGTPGHLVDWLCRGLHVGHRAPIGYLHDARTVVYPFLCEPLATLAGLSSGEPLSYRDLGIGPGVRLHDPLRIASRPSRARFLEQLPPASLAAYAAQQLLRLIPPDPWLSPIRERRDRANESANPGSGKTPREGGRFSRSGDAPEDPASANRARISVDRSPSPPHAALVQPLQTPGV